MRNTAAAASSSTETSSSAAAISSSAAAERWVDVIMFNDEADMLRYRIRLHAPFVSAIVVVESTLTFSGKPKSLHAQRALQDLSDTERAAINISVVQVRFSAEERAARSPWVREVAQRRFVGSWIQANFANHLVYLSDVDELLDGRELRLHRPWAQSHECFRPTLRFYYYSEHCPRGLWSQSLVFRTNSSFLRSSLAHGIQLRADVSALHSLISRSCPRTSFLSGWHLSYAMPTAAILRKLRDFSHAHDGVVVRLLHEQDPARVVEERVRSCSDIFERNGSVKKKYQGWHDSAFDGVLPWLSNWPYHPMAAAPSSSQLATARGTHSRVHALRV